MFVGEQFSTLTLPSLPPSLPPSQSDSKLSLQVGAMEFSAGVPGKGGREEGREGGRERGRARGHMLTLYILFIY